MPLRFEHADGVLSFAARGDVEFEAGTSVLEAGLWSAAKAEPETRWHLRFDIQDSSEARESDEVREIAKLIAAHRDHLSGKCVVIATDDLRYGMARVFQAFMENLGLECAVFHQPGEAQAWLGAPHSPGVQSPSP